MTIFMVTHKMRLHLQEIRNVYYYETITGDPTVAEWGDIVDEIRADFVAQLTSRLVAEWVFYGIDYREVSTAGLFGFEALPTLGDLAGGSALDSLPTQIAILVSVKGTTVKPNRARTYLGGWDEGQMADSLVASGTRTACQTFVDLQSVLNAAGTNELQRVAAQWNTTHTLVAASNNIAGSASKASQVPATQRRRRIGVGI